MALISQPLSSKITITAWCLGLALTVILLRLVHLQVIQGHFLYTKSQKNFLRMEVIPPLRGNILDQYGVMLATNRPTTNIYWQGTGNKKLTQEQHHILTTLGQILGKDLTNEHSLGDIAKAEYLNKKYQLAEDISYEQLSQLVEQVSAQKNIFITTCFKRHYPYKSWASHLLGYLGRMNSEIYGKMGLEKLFEETLRGQKGERLKTINSVGRHLEEVEIKKALAGDHIQLTLDIRLQEIIETIFPRDWVGTFLIMEPETGNILALLSRPDFDPGLFLDPLDHEEWLALQDKHPFLNRAFNACYPPGSLFKLVSLSAALEQRYVRPDDYWYCGGHIDFAGREYSCHNKHGHGMINTEQALALSCNILFYELGKRISIDLLADYAHRYGLGTKTNTLFAEKTGLIPTSEWKKRVKGEKWWPGETLSASIGQSYILVTPIQIARMISSIFTGFLVTPHILMDEPIHRESLAISKETRIFLQQSMKAVIHHGTGRRIKQVKDITIFAKTSTAQTSQLDKRELGTSYLEHGWFAGYFFYKDQKPLTIVILVENAGSSMVATSLAKDFLVQYKKLVDTSN